MALKEEEREQKSGIDEVVSQTRRVSVALLGGQSMWEEAKPKQVARRKSGTIQKKIKSSQYVGYLIDNICAVDFIYDVNFDAGKDETGI